MKGQFQAMPGDLCRSLCRSTALAFASLGCASFAWAIDFSLSGFGTVGYAVSDQTNKYLRYIDSNGTLKADSLIGLQGEARFNPQWSATAQIVASAPRTRDDGVDAQVRWAFVSYRPDNDCLLRAGRLRVPFFINSQNAEVGVTFNVARLPPEIYGLFPVYDLDGAAFTKTWAAENSEISLDGYAGKTKIKFRVPVPADPSLSLFPDPYLPERVEAFGLILSRTAGPLLLKAGAHRVTLKPSSAQQVVDGVIPTPFPAPPPFGGTLYVPGNVIDKTRYSVLTLGADWQSEDWRVTGEYMRRFISDTTIGMGGQSFAATLERNIGKWTPYFTYARLLSAPETRMLYGNLIATPVPLGALGPPLFLPPNYHKLLASPILVHDQYSTMLGTSYNLSPNSKLKFEWMRTKVGLASVLVDGGVHDKSFNVFSMSYNFAF